MRCFDIMSLFHNESQISTEVFAICDRPSCVYGEEMVHGGYRKALAMLNDNACRHHDAQQRQPAGFHTAPLAMVKVTFGIKY